MSIDDNLFPPHEFLHEELAERGWDKLRLAHESGLTSVQVDLILRGEPIDDTTAVALGRALGTGPELWLNLQRMHDADITHSEPKRSTSD